MKQTALKRAWKGGAFGCPQDVSRETSALEGGFRQLDDQQFSTSVKARDTPKTAALTPRQGRHP
ncbi:MAG: hypothetical protein IKD70_04300 [Eggerthellaceae bacterium]|nr:hypothetical protein [Eggerthellaceae bacterium]